MAISPHQRQLVNQKFGQERKLIIIEISGLQEFYKLESEKTKIKISCVGYPGTVGRVIIREPFCIVQITLLMQNNSLKVKRLLANL